MDIPRSTHRPEIVPLLIDAEAGTAVASEIGRQVIAGIVRILCTCEVGHGPAYVIAGGTLAGAFIGILYLADIVAHETVTRSRSRFIQDFVHFQTGVGHEFMFPESFLVGDLVHVGPVGVTGFVLGRVAARLATVVYATQRFARIVNVLVRMLIIDLEGTGYLQALDNLPVHIHVKGGLDGFLVILIIFPFRKFVLLNSIIHFDRNVAIAGVKRVSLLIQLY